MEAKSLAFLEFGKILGLISAFAGSQAAKDAVAALSPLTNPEEIEKRLADLDELILFLDEGRHMPIGGIREMRDLIDILKSGEGILTGEELLRIRANLEVFQHLRKALFDGTGKEGRTFPRLNERLQHVADLSGIGKAITQTISEQGEVRDDASPRLQSIRRDLAKSHSEIERRLTDYLGSNTEIFQDRFFTIRNDRYVLPVKAQFQNQVQGIVHDQSGSGQTVFIEPLEFLAQNNRLARLKAEVREEVIRILTELTTMLSERVHDVSGMFDVLVFFDVLYARARFARTYDAHRPVIGPQGSFDLKRARHPLIHPDCVPLDITMDQKLACIIITGPNGGGKTVVLKTVGINALLMQVGSYVLAEVDSRLPVFSEILVDIGESQSIEDHLSTFTSHIKRLNEILNQADQHSLVLVDEIGGGTDPVEGAALAVGVLRALLRRGSLSITTSHYDSLKQAAFTTPGFGNAGMEFDYEHFCPTFRFLQGVPGRSNALAVARMFGVPEEVLSEMSSLLAGKGGRETELLESLERERMKAESLRRSWEEREREVKLRQEELEKSLSRLEEFRKTRRDELVDAYEERLQTQVKGFESLIHDLKTQIGLGESSEKSLQEARSALGETKKTIVDLGSFEGSEHSSRQPATALGERPLETGEMVFWGGIPTPGEITSLDQGQKRAMVDFEGKSLNVALSELRRVPEMLAMKKKLQMSGGGIAMGSAPVVRSEIDLRGMRADEALEKTEEYLRMAAVQKLDKVFLIHGKGTGALQRAILEYLKHSPYRSKFRSGKYGEGDLGVTVVVFNPASDDHERQANPGLKREPDSGNRKSAENRRNRPKKR